MNKNLIILAVFTTLVQANTPTNVTLEKNTTQQVKTVPVQKVQAYSKSLVTSSISTSWIDQKIEEIKPQRNGLSKSYLASLQSPFIVILPEQKKTDGVKGKEVKSVSDKAALMPTMKDMSKEPLTLQIVLNSSALINGEWLKENDTFRGYTLAQIQSNHVVLERKNKKIKLFIAQKSKNINISTK